MADIRQFLIWGLLIGLFSISLLSFGIQMNIDNNPQSDLLSSPYLESVNQTTQDVTTQIKLSQTNSENQSKIQEGTSPTTSSGDLLLDSTPGTIQTVKKAPKQTISLILGMITIIFRANSVILATITTIILITLIALIWSFIKSGR